MPRQQALITKLVDQILAVKRTDQSADTLALEQEIDRLVCQLYDLTEDETRDCRSERRGGEMP